MHKDMGCESKAGLKFLRARAPANHTVSGRTSAKSKRLATRSRPLASFTLEERKEKINRKRKNKKQGGMGSWRETMFTRI
jgi:hypothetical protein